MNIQEYNMPDVFLSALINGDCSGLDKWDYKALGAWIITESEGKERFHVLCDSDDNGFCKYHCLEPYGIGACNCVTILVDIGNLPI